MFAEMIMVAALFGQTPAPEVKQAPAVTAPAVPAEKDDRGETLKLKVANFYLQAENLQLQVQRLQQALDGQRIEITAQAEREHPGKTIDWSSAGAGKLIVKPAATAKPTTP